jgi:hypothetical protein
VSPTSKHALIFLHRSSFYVIVITDTPVPQDTPYGNTEANLDIQSGACATISISLSHTIPCFMFQSRWSLLPNSQHFLFDCRSVLFVRCHAILISNLFSSSGAPPWNPDENTSSDSSEPYLELLDYLLGATDIPTVLTTSYGDDEQSVPYGYALRVCRGFAALGAR